MAESNVHGAGVAGCRFLDDALQRDLDDWGIHRADMNPAGALRLVQVVKPSTGAPAM